MSTISGVPATKHWFICWVTLSAPATDCTRTVPGTNVHESTVMRRFTAWKAVGSAGTMREACRGRARAARSAAVAGASDLERYMFGSGVVDVGIAIIPKAAAGKVTESPG